MCVLLHSMWDSSLVSSQMSVVYFNQSTDSHGRTNPNMNSFPVLWIVVTWFLCSCICYSGDMSANVDEMFSKQNGGPTDKSAQDIGNFYVMF